MDEFPPRACAAMLALLVSALLLVASAEWEEVSGFPQTYSRYYGPHAGAMSEDASKTVIVGRKEVGMVWKFSENCFGFQISDEPLEVR